MFAAPLPTITDDLRIMLGDHVATLTPTQGLCFAEDLARKAFRRALSEEADRAASAPAGLRLGARFA